MTRGPRRAPAFRSRHRGRGGQGGHDGSAAVEFALVLPLVLLLALATLQVALLTKDQLIVQGAARAGAREAAVSTDDSTAQRAAIDAAVGLEDSQIEVLVQRGADDGAVSVSVTYHAPIAVGAIAWLFPDHVDLSATAMMRQETG